jgi:hypothetical protein
MSWMTGIKPTQSVDLIASFAKTALWPESQESTARPRPINTRLPHRDRLLKQSLGAKTFSAPETMAGTGSVRAIDVWPFEADETLFRGNEGVDLG